MTPGRLALAGAIAAAALALPAGAQVFAVSCKDFAEFAWHLAYLRQMGARLELVEAEIERTGGVAGATAAQLKREARRVWARRPARQHAADSAYERCTKALGDLGADA